MFFVIRFGMHYSTKIMHFRYKLRSDCFETPKNDSLNQFWLLGIWISLFFFVSCFFFFWCGMGLCLLPSIWQGWNQWAKHHALDALTLTERKNFGFFVLSCSRLLSRNLCSISYTKFSSDYKQVADGWTESILPHFPSDCNLITKISLWHCGHTKNREKIHARFSRSSAVIYMWTI